MGRMNRHGQGQVKFHEGSKAKNPVVFTYRLLNNTPDFDGHLWKLYHAQGLPASTAGRVMQLCELVGRHDRNMTGMATAILEKYTNKGADGRPKGWDEKKFEWNAPDAQERHDKEMIELFDTKVVLPLERIPLAHLEHARLSAATLRALDFMILGLPKMKDLPEGVAVPEGYKGGEPEGEASACKPEEVGSSPTPPSQSSTGAIAP